MTKDEKEINFNVSIIAKDSEQAIEVRSALGMKDGDIVILGNSILAAIKLYSIFHKDSEQAIEVRSALGMKDGDIVISGKSILAAIKLYSIFHTAIIVIFYVAILTAIIGFIRFVLL